MFFPTKSLRMGNSRCPRSTRAASCIRTGRPRSVYRVQRGPYRPTGVQDIIDEHHRSPGNVDGNRGRPHCQIRSVRKVIPVQADVEVCNGNNDPFGLFDVTCQPLRQRNTAGANAQREPGCRRRGYVPESRGAYASGRGGSHCRPSRCDAGWVAATADHPHRASPRWTR